MATEIEYNESTITGYDWLHICSITKLMDTNYIIIFNDLRHVIWDANTGNIFTIAED